eukprot:10645613-Karenia_brevis.AAC.1
MDQAVPKLLDETDHFLGKQRYEFATLNLPSSDGVCCVKTQCGGLMGDPYIVHAFSRAFHPCVCEWQMRQREYDPWYDAMYTICPITNTMTDISLTKYADDLVKLLIARPHAAAIHDMLHTVQEHTEQKERFA